MTIGAETLALLMQAGLAGEQLLTVVRSIEADNQPMQKEVSKGTLRMRRLRERRDADSVTNCVTCDATGDALCDAVEPVDPAPNKSPPDPQKLTPTPGVCITHAREADPISIPVWFRIEADLLAIAVAMSLIKRARLEAAMASGLAAWNGMAQRAGLPTVKRMTPERGKRLRARLAEHGPDAFTEAIAAIERSAFCRGDSRDGWRADFDFLLQASSFTKLIEGSYDRQPALRTGQRSHHNGPADGPRNPMVRAVLDAQAERAARGEQDLGNGWGTAGAGR